MTWKISSIISTMIARITVVGLFELACIFGKGITVCWLVYIRHTCSKDCFFYYYYYYTVFMGKAPNRVIQLKLLN